MKRANIITAILCLQLIIMQLALHAQAISFNHLNTSNGLSENNVRSVAIDKNGFLWIGTTDGLNVYDGYNITSYKTEEYPALASDNIIHLTCDSRNRIWMGTPEGISWLDEKRKFHRVILNDSVARFASRSIMDTRTYGPVLFTSLGQFYFDEQKQNWSKLNWIPSSLAYNRFSDAEPFESDKVLYATDSLVLILDYSQKKIVFEQPFTSVFSLCRYNDHEIAVGLEHGKVQIVDIRTKQIVREYEISSEMEHETINSTVTEVRPAANGDLLVATGYAGLVIIDKSGKLSRYTHDPINPRSIGSNLTWRALSGANGDIVIGTRVAGVSIFNIFNKQAEYKALFGDANGNFFDNYVNDIKEDKNESLWICAQDRLIKWDPKKQETKFYYYHFMMPKFGMQRGELRTGCFDRNGKLWVSIYNDGIATFDEASGQFKKFSPDTSLGQALRSNYVHTMMLHSDGRIWVGSGLGIYAIDPRNNAVTCFADHPQLKNISGKRVIGLFEDSRHRVWIGASGRGVYCFDPAKNQLMEFSTKQGMNQNTGYGFIEDRSGNIYVATGIGFNIITPDNTVQCYTKSNGLRFNRCESFLEDEHGYIWIANDKCLVKFDPVRKTMEYFDENAGMNRNGFRPACALKRKNGELVWGCQDGVNYFFPSQLVNNPRPLSVAIHQATVHDTLMSIGESRSIKIPYAQNNISFAFTAVNLSSPGNILYQYMLEGYDREWQKGVDVRLARYVSLPEGHYVFKVRASKDGVNWTAAGNEIGLYVVPSLWHRWWFLAGTGILIGIALFYLVMYRNQKIRRQKEEIETDQAINYFASSMYDQQTVETILWDVAKNCIGRLKIEDGVSYLVDEEKKMLVQKAAHGPKTTDSYEIHEPIEIPIGYGITGTVAKTGKPEIINDTSKDARYIVDDMRRCSEIAVPIISDGKVLGVIDSEHSQRNFFTPRHLSILTTIASLCAHKLVRAKAEEEKQKAQMILLHTQQKMTEVEMQALRAQMNPHFIFNCLNSINRYIVKSDQATASLYLTKFAKLIRLILDNSNNKNVMLSHELEALKLYIDMEALRFDKKFSYSIDVDKHVNADCIEVPPLIIQPYVENAIWHGLLHKNNIGHLRIRITLPSPNMLQCVIEDNGVGREKARELRSKTATTKKSLGMKLTENRLSLLNKHAELNASIEIIDLYNEIKEPAGTKVILTIPV